MANLGEIILIVLGVLWAIGAAFMGIKLLIEALDTIKYQ